MAQFHHGISKKEPASGIIPMRDAETNTIALLAFSNDADPLVFPLNTPVLVTSINRALAASGTEGNLRASLETISAITNPTLIVVRIPDPFLPFESPEPQPDMPSGLNQSLVIGTTLPTGQRTGLQAFLTAKSILGLTPKIIIAPDVETPEVVQTLASICQKLRAYSYITPRDQYGVMLETMEQVVTYRDTLGVREIEIIWPEWTSGNVFLGKSLSSIISCDGASSSASLGLQFEPSENLEYFITIDGIEVLSGALNIERQFDNVTIQYTDTTLEFMNTSALNKRVEILSLKQDDRKYLFKPIPQESLNQTLFFEGGKDGLYSKVSFCLSGFVE